MSDTHGGMIALYERVSTIHHAHSVMVPLIVSICQSTRRNLLIAALLHPCRMSLCHHWKPQEPSLWQLCKLAEKSGLSPYSSGHPSASRFQEVQKLSPKALVLCKHMSDTHEAMIALYERVSTIHHPHIVMVPLIVSICQSMHRDLLIAALLHLCRTSLCHH
jgi:hypothetical protein